ncbi:MAG: T9SS type A sorting domain-containing protein, partial [Ferruginibacter sp.]
FGLYMLVRNTNQFIKVDTTNGNITVIGTSVPSVGSNWSGMTYNPANGKIYAIAFNSFSELYEINRITGAATLVGVIPGTENFSLIWIAADTNGDMFTMRLAIGLPSQIFKIGLQPLSITALSQNTGFESNFAQDAAIDSITGKLFLFGNGRPIGSSENFAGQGLWNADKISGNATLIGALVQSFNQFDGLTFAGKEYRYQWSPATGLDNPNAPNPVFSAPTAGAFTYTLTVTDLCGNTSSDQVVVIVNPAPEKVAITPTSAVLNHRNAFTSTLSYTPIANINYRWQLNGVALTNTTTNQSVNSINTVNDRFTVLATNPITGCTSVSTAVQPVFSTGVVLNDNGSYSVCDTSYYDAGGANGNTTSSFTQTFTPTSAGRKMAFTIYNLQLAAGNTLAVYDGNSISAPRIVNLTSAQNGTATQQFVASNADGVLTIQYTTGASTSIGWFGGLTCVQPFVFRTINNGNWNTASIWQSKSMGDPETAWATATRVPVKSDDSVYIRHNISITSATSIDQITINNGAILSVDNGGSIVANKVNNSPEIVVNAGGLLRVSAFRQITGDNAIIDAKGNVENSGTINVSEVRFTGTTAQQLTAYGTNGSISKMVVQNAAGIGIVGIHEISFLQFVNGELFTNPFNTVIIQAFAGASAASYINGPAKTRINTAATVQQIPIGENGNYRPVSIRANNASASGGALFIAEVLPGAPYPRNLPTGLASISEVRYYSINIEENSGNLSNFVITLSYGADDGVSTPSFCKIAKDDGGENWLNIGGNATQPAPSTISSNVINSWGEFVLAFTAVAPIPVTLVSFTALPTRQQVNLNWKVDNEVNFLGYGVERSVDGRNFTSIGFVPVQTIRSGHYQFNDPLLQLSFSQVYYRLKLVEQTGSYRYSSILRIALNQSTEGNFGIYPNPVVNQLHVQYWAKQSGNVIVQLFNAQTQLLTNKTVFVMRGQNALLVPTAHLPRGMYFIACIQNGQKLVQRFIKQ